ncbi:hypothetical protein [Mucilaginibacter myungsuensis]|uniref:Uncharacterized protein n=1 Tax=Mucilaginibacter myungsuensis TaxID=649104 RepID=A0A929L4T3_9SPHI|nr:hypothetical protein [Mucilaginibacter myungsuensis]MBE9664469.1 hypothetical protein [Mucilaginibacter myungsuensis]MDN3601386.1 hypothetical protein [Mucilaginibacter myungsuensis]
MSHTFHIPVLGLGYSVDTPLKVARYGITSTMSIVDDELTERMREYHSLQNDEPYSPINKADPDARARRVEAYLNLVNKLVQQQFIELKQQPFEPGSDICRYFEMLPDCSQLKQGYDLMMDYPDCERKTIFQNVLRQHMTIGAMDVNLMAKVDKMNFTGNGDYLGDENTDALAGLRGFVNSDIYSSVVLSAGMNPKLYSYLESFEAFLPDRDGRFKKKIILKVSDFRSAFIQAKFLAKKGIWVSEFRVESGLNCGGHAFATEGFLLGPILEEFKQKRTEMQEELYALYLGALLAKGVECNNIPIQKLSVQGGIGTAEENTFLMDHYQLDATGWGSPFLLVPEATNVDEDTLHKLIHAKEGDYYVSNSSPLGILFNNFRGSTIEQQRIDRIKKRRPGSPCTKKYLCSNTEFTEQPICTASRQYQSLKIAELQAAGLSEDEYQQQYQTVTEKLCLCEGLCSSTYLKYDIVKPRENTAVAICPGPNLAYFNHLYSLDEMVAHIYGKIDLLQNIKRPHAFIKELNLYIEHLQTDLQNNLKHLSDKKAKQLEKFSAQIRVGINYYKELFSNLTDQATELTTEFFNDLTLSENKLDQIRISAAI